MFGLFKKKMVTFDCPMCGVNMGAKLDMSDRDGALAYRQDHDLLADGSCPFCKLEVDISIEREGGQIRAFDGKWEAARKASEKKVETLDQQQFELEADVDEIEGEIEDLKETPGADVEKQMAALNKKLSSARKKLEAAESRKEKAEEAFDSKEERYEERQMRWQEKYDEKYG